MNEPTVAAQKHTGKVTAKVLRDHVKAGNRLYMHGRATPDRESYSDSFIFTVSSSSRESYESRVEIIAKLDVPGNVRNGNTSKREEHTSSIDGSKWMKYTEAFRPTEGFWSFFGARERLLDILELLPNDAEVSFEVYLDAGTNEYLVRANSAMTFENIAGLHSDHLYLEVRYFQRGKEKRRSFLLDTSCGAHNSARFGGPSRF